MERLRRLRAGISHHDSAERFTKLGVDVYIGRGEFTSGNTVTVRWMPLACCDRSLIELSCLRVEILRLFCNCFDCLHISMFWL